MIRIAYLLILFSATSLNFKTSAFGQNSAPPERTSTEAAALTSKAPDAVPTPSASAERPAAKNGVEPTADKPTKPDRESAKRSYKAGLKYERGGLTRQAAESYQQAIDHDPEFADAYSALGQTYISLARYQEAVAALEKAVKLNPRASTSFTLLGQAYAKLKETAPAAGKTETSNPIQPAKLPIEPPPAAAAVESDPKAVYFVGISDVLDIRIPGSATQESTLYVVSSNGQIDHPLLSQAIKVSGLTTNQIATLISTELKRLSLGNQMAPEVSVRDYNSHTIMVSGLVKEPGTKVLRREGIPLYVVLADAQLLPDAAAVDVMAAGMVKHRGIDVSNPDQTNILIRPGDVVTVKAAAKRFFYVGGNVKSPGELSYRSGLTLTQAILSAGGVTLKGDRVQLTRGQGNGLLTLQEFKLSEINRGKTPDPLIEPGDRISILP